MYVQSLIELSAHAGTIIVPNTSCGRLLRAALDQLERQRDVPTWRTADAIAWSTYLTRCFEEISFNGALSDDFDVDFVLSAEQERSVWEAVIAHDPAVSLFAPEQTAAVAQAAWHTLHAWNLSIDTMFNSAVSDDVVVFGRWIEAYKERTAELHVGDQARLMAHLMTRHGENQPALVAHGFLGPAPAIKRLLETHGVGASRLLDDHRDRKFNCRSFSEREAEMYAAMEWAVDVGAADPQARIVVALEGLHADQFVIRRCVADVIAQHDAEVNDDHVYLGVAEPLLNHPMIRAALNVLEFSQVMPWDALSALLRSPWITGAAGERFERALFDEEIRALDRYELPAPFVMNFLADSAYPCAQFARMWLELTRLATEAPSRQRLVEWLDHFDRCLNAAGWPGDGELTGTAVATLHQWGGACDRLNRLDAVVPPMSRGEAIRRLRRALADTTARETPADPRIFFVTPEQACVLQPTHLWLAGASRDAFVTAAHPSPLIPFEMQRAAGIPGADANRDLYRARQLIQTLAHDAHERVASYSRSDGDLIVNPSLLIAGLGDADAETPLRYLPDSWRRARLQAELSTFVDTSGPALARHTRLRGGVAAFAAQAACPFQSFARHRLTATPVAEPRPGIDRRHKGQVIHGILATLWMRLKRSRELAALDRDDRRRAIREAIAENAAPMPFETQLEREIRFVERDRLTALMETWLDFELSRAPFTVSAVEQSATVTFEDLEIRIRVDRIDRLNDEQEIIIDYKTGACRAADWVVPRLNQPQLPFYALTFPAGQTSAVAFAKVDRQEPKWIQVPREALATDQALVDHRETWRADLITLAAGIRDGDARLDPKHGGQTCRLCEMHPFCRVAEIELTQDDDGESDD